MASEKTKKSTNELLLAILKLKNQKEAADFFRDLLTLKEINDLTIRFQIAKLLFEKKHSYLQIARKCRVSTTTVTRVAHWLNHGLGGYRLVLKRLQKK
ncbi:MAG: helix-turn-helix domain-containing protein [Candidatus Pacebacteria bacterium]|nr:helix-turn-helix domain-containing protein [Candidatus Paceibacterota bacterium]